MAKDGKQLKRIEPKIEKFKLGQLVPAEYNPRTISAEAMEGLTNSIKTFGCVEPIVVNVRKKANRIVGGHQRYKALLELSGPGCECICITVDLNEAAEKRLNLTLNNPAVQGEFIKDLARYIDELKKQLPDDNTDLALQIDALREQLGDNSKQPGCNYKEEILRPFKKTHVLISFSPELLPQIQNHLLAIIKTEGIEYEQSSN